MNIIFAQLNRSHFPKLLEWLNKSHVNLWWDRDITWTIEKVKAKYGPRINSKDIRCYVITISHFSHPELVSGSKNEMSKQVRHDEHNKEIGYIQIYDAYKFPRSKSLTGLPKNLGSIDIFIGDDKYMGRNIGAEALKLFIENYCEFEYIFVDPDMNNIAAISCYKKAGFKEVAKHDDTGEIWMIKSKKHDN